MARRPLLALVASCLALTTCPIAQADLLLRETGAAVLGNTTTMEITGTPGVPYLLLLSLQTGPTPLPPPHVPSLDVGLELATLSFTLPGFNGVLDGTGKAQIPLPFPPLLGLNALTLRFQAVRHDGVTMLEKSNRCDLTPNLPMFPEYTLGDMATRRAGYTVTPLADGRFLFIGGGADGVVASFGEASMEAYDPCTQTFTHVGNLSQPRVSHTATLLADGRILVVGGADFMPGEPTATAEIIDPANNFASTPTANNMPSARALHSATRLPDNRVLIAGGTASFNDPLAIVENATASTLFYNPTTNAFTAGPAMSEPRVGHTATTLNNNQVLIAGGYSYVDFVIFKIPFITDSAQLYTPAAGGAGFFSANITMTSDRFGHAAVLKDDGKVLLFGGAMDVLASPFNPQATDTVEQFDPVSKTFQPHGLMVLARGAVAVAKAPNGRFIVAGGAYGSLGTPTPVQYVDLYDGNTGATSSVSMNEPRANCQCVALPNGAFLVAGGGEEPDPQNPANPVSHFDAELITIP